LLFRDPTRVVSSSAEPCAANTPVFQLWLSQSRLHYLHTRMSVGSCRFGVLAAATFGYSCAAKQRRSAKSRDTLALTFDANQGRTRLHYKCVFYTGQRNPWVDEI
jgi:hypothetical protein